MHLKRMDFNQICALAFSITRETCAATSLYNCKCDMCGGARNFRVKGGIGARRFNHLLMCVGTGKAGSGEGIKMIVAE
jgi:hypothetical protein